MARTTQRARPAQATVQVVERARVSPEKFDKRLAKAQELLVSRSQISKQLRSESTTQSVARSSAPHFPDEPVQCPECEHELSDVEIEAGFENHPLDSLVECPECGARFPVLGRVTFRGKSELYVRLCAVQTRAAVKRWRETNVPDDWLEELSEDAPHLYWNLYRHAFACHNIESVCDAFLAQDE